MTSAARLLRILQLIFRQQARDAASTVTSGVLERGEAPDLSHWIPATATAIRPIMLEIFQQGYARTHQQIVLDKPVGLPPTPDLTEGLRRYEIGNEAAFGEKAWNAALGILAVIEKAKGKKKDDRFFHSAKLDLFNPKILDAVDQAVLHLCRETMETATGKFTDSIQAVRNLIKEGMGKGKAVALLGKKIKEIFADPVRAQRIAVTEVVRAENGGQLMAAKESKKIKKKVWRCNANACTHGGPKDEGCVGLDGVKRDLGRPFWVNPDGGPYAVVQHPGLHPGCLCSMSFE